MNTRSGAPVHGRSASSQGFGELPPDMQTGHAGAEGDSSNSTLPKDGWTSVRVAGEAPPQPKPKKTVVKQPLDAHLASGRLRLYCFDRTTGEPITGVALHLNTVTNVNQGKAKNIANAFGNVAYSRPDGMALLKLMAGHTYVITATCKGFHKFGELGEYLLVTPKDNEIVEQTVGMVPIRISIMVTLRELRPVAGRGMLHDPYGQVNPLYSPPRVDKMSVQPQKVSFDTPSGKQTFLATTMMASQVLRVTGDIVQPAALAQTRIALLQRQDQEAQQQQQEQAARQLQQQQSRRSRVLNKEEDQIEAVSKSIMPINHPIGVDPVTEVQLFNPDGCMCVYSSDSEGHCFFYGPRIDFGKPGGIYREWHYLDSGMWQYTAKYHLVTNKLSPTYTLFDKYPLRRMLPGSRPRSPSPNRTPAEDTKSGKTKANRPRTAPPGGRRNNQSSGSALKRGWLGTHPEIDEMIQPPSGSVLDTALRSPRPKSATAGRSPSAAAGAGGGASPGNDVSAKRVVVEDSEPDPTAVLNPAPNSLMGNMPLDPEGVHNYLHPGDYDISLTCDSHLLIFYTYTGDREMAQISKAQGSLVQVTMREADDSYLAPKAEGSPTKQSTFPVQLYCRARPWFQIVVYDMDTLEEVGAKYGFQFSIQRIDYSRSLMYRVERMWGILAAAHTRDPSKIPVEERDFDALEYIAQQERRGKLAGLWAKAELQELERMGDEADVSEAVRTSGATGGYSSFDPTQWKRQFEDLEDDMDNAYTPHAEGRLADDLPRVWATPGHTYAVTVTAAHPYVEMVTRQARPANWELEPFVFYAVRKVALLVGLRETFSQMPCEGVGVQARLLDWPKPPRPPIVRPEWCEPAHQYARRVLDQLMDYVVQSQHPDTTGLVGTEFHAEANSEGIATIYLPPGAVVSVSVNVREDFEEEDSTNTKTLTREPEQFLGFQLQRICHIFPSVLHAVTGEPLAGFTIKAYDVTHLVPDPPRPGPTPMPSPAPTPKRMSKRTKPEPTDDEKLRDAVSLEGLEPIWASVTAADGLPVEPLRTRAGRVLKVVVVDTPPDFLLPGYFRSGSGTQMIATSERHHLKFLAPPKPRVRVRVQDICTMEDVLGVKLRVMVRYTEPPLIAEGETKSPQQLLREREEVLTRAKFVEEQVEAARLQAEAIAAADAKAAAVAAAVAVAMDAAGLVTGDAAGGTDKEGSGAEGVPASGVTITEQSSTSSARQGLKKGQPGKRSQKGPDARASPTQEEDEEEEEGEEEEDKPRGGGGLPLDLDGPNALTNLDQVHWDGKRVPRGMKPKSGGSGRPPSRSGSRAGPPGDERGLTARVLDRIGDMAGTGEGGGFQGNGQMQRTRVGRTHEDISAWAALEAAAAARRSAVRERQGRSKPKFTGGTPGNGFMYVPSEAGESTHHLGSEPSMMYDADEVAKAEEENPEDLEPWGPVWHDTFTGDGEVDFDAKGLMVDAGVEVAVQVLPAWPFAMAPQIRVSAADGWRDPPLYEFILARDDGAFRFWLERDRALHTFYELDGKPCLPYHPLARLQPLARPHRVMARRHQGMRLLKPVGNGWVYEQAPRDIAASDDDPSGYAWGGSGGAGGGGPGGAGGGGGGGGGGGVAGGDSSGGPSRGQDGGARLGSPDKMPGVNGSEHHRSWLFEEDTPLREDPSAIQFDESGGDADDVRAAAWAHIRLADTQFLPIERTRLMSLLAKWGAFPHLQGGTCRACQGPAPSPTSPFLMRSAIPLPQSNKPSPGGDKKDDIAAAGFKSSLLNTGTHDLSAAWALDRPTNAFRRPSTPPHLSRHLPDKHARTHRIIGQSEAIYCETPFFTWRLGNGTAVHVGVHELLYRELIALLDSTAKSLEFMGAHISKVHEHNNKVGTNGRFLLGDSTVEGCKGGLFVMDVSAAQPYGAPAFILDQIGALWDHWSTMCEDQGAEPPLVNVMAVAGSHMELFREDLVHVPGAGNVDKLRAWYENVKCNLPRDAPDFRIPAILDVALRLTGARVPIYLLCGGLVSQVDDAKRLSKVLYRAQLRCMESQRPLQPIHTVEMYPMPRLNDSRGKGVVGTSRFRAVTGSPTNYAGTTDDDGRDDYPSSPDPRHHALASAPSLSDVSAMGADIFELIADAMAQERVRLVEVFREMDRDGSGSLNTEQLNRLVKRFVPDAQPTHLRYLQLILDADGNARISYKELATAMKAANRGGVRLLLRDHIEVHMLLQRVAILMLLEGKNCREFFDTYDLGRDGYLDHVEQWRMLKSVFPGITPEEQRELFAALQAVDINSDERISFDEWQRAFASGGSPELQAWGVARDAEEMKRMKADGGGLSDLAVVSMRADQDYEVMRGVRAAGFPLHVVLERLSGSTRGWCRRLDLGRARAFAEPIDLQPLLQQKAQMQRSLDTLMAFEASYGTQLTLERSSRPGGHPLMPQPGGGGGALVALEPPTTHAVASKARGVSGAELGRQAVQAERAKQEAAYGSPPTAKKKVRPASAGRRRPSMLADGPSESLLSNTAGRAKYIQEVKLSRSASAASLLGDLPARRPSNSGGKLGPNPSLSQLSTTDSGGNKGRSSSRPRSASSRRSTTTDVVSSSTAPTSSAPPSSSAPISSEISNLEGGSEGDAGAPSSALEAASTPLRKEPSGGPKPDPSRPGTPRTNPSRPSSPRPSTRPSSPRPSSRPSSPRPASASSASRTASLLSKFKDKELVPPPGRSDATPRRPTSAPRRSFALGSGVLGGEFEHLDKLTPSPSSGGSSDVRTARRHGPAGFKATVTQNVRASSGAQSSTGWNP